MTKSLNIKAEIDIYLTKEQDRPNFLGIFINLP